MFWLLCLYLCLAWVQAQVYGVLEYVSRDKEIDVLAAPIPLATDMPLPMTSGIVNCGISLRENGLLVTNDGTFYASFNAVLVGAPDTTCEFTMYLIVDSAFTPESSNMIWASNTITPSQVVQFSASGILVNLVKEQMLRLVVQNKCSDKEMTVRLRSWNMAVHRLACQ